MKFVLSCNMYKFNLNNNYFANIYNLGQTYVAIRLKAIYRCSSLATARMNIL